MYIQPNSTIKLLRNVPIDPNQTDTLYFDSTTSQYNYFVNKSVMTFENNTYQRVNKGACRLNVLSDKVYDVNYMMFKNTNYSGKWFYAFVDEVEYINDNTTEIKFTIDPIQSWFFEYESDECFVERETTPTDDIGEHIEPEKLGVGEYVINGTYEAIGTTFSDQCIIIAWNDPDETYVNMHDGVMTACKLLAYDTTISGINEVKNFIDSQSAHPDSIINIYMCPKALIGEINSTHVISYGSSGTSITAYMNAISTNDTLDGYLPKNNKMYTYPYSFYHVDAPSGQSLITRYEFFKDLKPCFTISGNITTPVELVCIPSQYKGSKPKSELTSPEEYRPERLSIKGIPICNWSVDYYSNWLAQNSVPMLVNSASTLGIAVATENPMIGAMAVTNIAHTLSDFYRASIQADITKGSFNTGSNDYSNNRDYFKGSRMSVSHQIAKRIDDFFTCFGYNVGVVKKPNRYQRTRFTYVKTIGCNISGSLPSSDAKYIADCYDRGIRFWADHINVCDYTKANEILPKDEE